MHPRIFEVAAVFILSLDGLAVLVEDSDHLGSSLISCHVRSKLSNKGSKSLLVAFRTVLIGIEGAGLPHLELAAPETAVVAPDLAVIVQEDSRVNAVASLNIIFLRLERTNR